MSNITLLDGGMGQELIHRSGDNPTPLWATRVMIDNPGMVADVHRDYYAAGATIATTNTYAIHRDRLIKRDMNDEFENLHDAALAEAKNARPNGGFGRIAGSIGPLGASYRTDIHPDHTEATGLYAEIAQILSPGVDLILCETIASLAHARAVLEGALTAGKPVWLAVTVDDENGSLLRSGEPVADLCEIAKNGASAVLANCSAPEAISAALDALSACGLPYGAYANGFTMITKDFLKDSPTVNSLSPRRDLGPEIYADFAMGWVDQGATIIGGCCEVGPAHITELGRRLRQAGHTIV